MTPPTTWTSQKGIVYLRAVFQNVQHPVTGFENSVELHLVLRSSFLHHCRSWSLRKVADMTLLRRSRFQMRPRRGDCRFLKGLPEIILCMGCKMGYSIWPYRQKTVWNRVWHRSLLQSKEIPVKHSGRHTNFAPKSIAVIILILVFEMSDEITLICGLCDEICCL